MNILYVHNVGKIGGAERVTLDVIHGIDSSQHTAFLVTPEYGPFCEAAQEIGAQSKVLPICQPDIRKPLASYASYRSWLAYLGKHHIDLIHTGDLFVTRTLIRAANKIGIPLICHVHFPVTTPALRWIFKLRPQRCQFVYCSWELHDTVVPRLESILPEATHQVIHNGVDTERFQKFTPKRGLLPADKINIGIVANLQERKGHLDLIEAVARLHPKHPDILIHVIGGDLFGESREPLLKERVGETGLGEVFVFHGQVDNVADYLNELDIIVCASHEEAFPISMLEAMAFELPIATTDVNGIPEAIHNDENGLLFPPRNPDAMALALEKLLKNPEQRQRLGREARSCVVKSFSQERFSDQFAELYQKAGEPK